MVHQNYFLCEQSRSRWNSFRILHILCLFNIHLWIKCTRNDNFIGFSSFFALCVFCFDSIFFDVENTSPLTFVTFHTSSSTSSFTINVIHHYWCCVQISWYSYRITPCLTRVPGNKLYIMRNIINNFHMKKKYNWFSIWGIWSNWFDLQQCIDLGQESSRNWTETRYER